MISRLTKLIRDQRGANMAEYLILIAVVAVGGIAAFKGLNGGLASAIGAATNTLSTIASVVGK